MNTAKTSAGQRARTCIQFYRVRRLCGCPGGPIIFVYVITARAGNRTEPRISCVPPIVTIKTSHRIIPAFEYYDDDHPLRYRSFSRRDNKNRCSLSFPYGFSIYIYKLSTSARPRPVNISPTSNGTHDAFDGKARVCLRRNYRCLMDSLAEQSCSASPPPPFHPPPSTAYRNYAPAYCTRTRI